VVLTLEPLVARRLDCELVSPVGIIASMASQIFGGGETNGLKGNHTTEDPFLTTPSATTKPHNHRFSSFDTDLFALNQASSSPLQAKRALEAHLAETERRLHEASKLGTALVKQRQDLSDRLSEVERQQEDVEIGPELRQKLIDIEKEYVEVGRESARAGLGPKSRATSSEESTHSILSADGRVSDMVRQSIGIFSSTYR
jgi:hypothetical protein